MKKIPFWLFIAFFGTALFFTACEEENTNPLPGDLPPYIVDFRFAEYPDLPGTIDQDAGTIDLEVPNNADMTKLTPKAEPSFGATATPGADAPLDFTSAQTITATYGNNSKSYNVSVVRGGLDKTTSLLVVLGTAESPADLTNEDEKAAATWAMSTFKLAEYYSFDQLKANPSVLDNKHVVWWFHDATTELPAVATDPAVTDILKSYHANGGELYLSGFANQYLVPLGIVDADHGVNEVGGSPADSPNPDNWGISFKGNADHRAFRNLRLADQYSYPAAFLISGGALRKDNKSWWVVNADPTVFPANGIALAGTEWDPDRGVLIVMAEFPGDGTSGTTITFSAGAYDWYSPPGDSENTFLDNVYRVTENILVYLAQKN